MGCNMINNNNYEDKNMDQKNNLDKAPAEEYILLSFDEILYHGDIRSKIVEKGIDELAKSMKQYGQLQPVMVYKHDNKYVLIFGDRRCLAAWMAGLKTIKAILVPKPTFTELLYMKINENEHSRQYLKEDRNKYIRILIENGETVEKISENTGKSIEWVQMFSGVFDKKEKQKVPDNSGKTMRCKDASNALKNATDEEIEQAFELISPTVDKTFI